MQINSNTYSCNLTMEKVDTEIKSDKVPNKPKLLIMSSGSVASVLLREIILYGISKFDIKVVITQSAKVFSDSNIDDYKKFSQELGIEIFEDSDEWQKWALNKEVLHVELKKWADIVLLAPLSSNTLAKIANGISNNLLTCVLKAWEPHKPGFFALAMNTNMYLNPLTEEHIIKVKQTYGFHEIPVITKKLKCGDIGKGALARIETIYKAIYNYLNRKTILHYFKPLHKSNRI